MKRRYFRADAAFANPDVYYLLEIEDYKYTIRLPAHAVLQESIAWLLILVVLSSYLGKCVHDPGIAGERGEASGFGTERVPGGAERVHDGLLALVQAEGEVALPQVQPDPFRRAQLGRVGRQRQQRDLGRHPQGLRAVPAGLVEQEHGMYGVGQGRGEAGEEEAHGRRRRLRQHQGEGVVAAGTDGGGEVGGEEALVAAPRRPLATGEPAVAGASLLPLSGLVFTPQLHGLVRMRGGDGRELRCEVFHMARAPRHRPSGAPDAPSARTGRSAAAAWKAPRACRSRPRAPGCGRRCRADGSC